MFWIKYLMRAQPMKEPLGKESQLSPIINPKYIFTTNCVVPACISC